MAKIKKRTKLREIFPYFISFKNNNPEITDMFVRGAPTTDLTPSDIHEVLDSTNAPVENDSSVPQFETDTDIHNAVVAVIDPAVSSTPEVPTNTPVIPTPTNRNDRWLALGFTGILAAASMAFCTGEIYQAYNPIRFSPISTETFFHDTPEILLPPEREAKIFEYSKDQLLIHTKPEFGVSAYAATIYETDISELLAMTPEDQLALVTKYNRELRTYRSNSLKPILDLTIGIINGNDDVTNKNTTYRGLRNPFNNVIQPDITLTIPCSYSPRLEEIVEDQTAVELPGLKRTLEEYFELKYIERDNPAVKDDFVMNEVARNIATQYNSNQTNGSQTTFDLSLYSKEDRKNLASRLYRETSDRSSENYMTVDEILDLVNFGADEKIKYNQAQDGFSRNDYNKTRIQERRENIYKDIIELGTNYNARDLASKYGVSESTIRRIKKAKSVEAPDPKYVQKC